METILTFNDLPQLQAFIFFRHSRLTPEMVRKGGGVIPTLIKLNNKHYLRLRWPFSEEGVDCKLVSPEEAKKEVIPLESPIRQNELHAAIAKIGLGYQLINLED